MWIKEKTLIPSTIKDERPLPAHLVSISAAWMVLKSSSATPTPSTLMRWGWNRASGASNLSPPTLITLPSGSWGHTQNFCHQKCNNVLIPLNTVLSNCCLIISEDDHDWPCTTPLVLLSPAPASAPARCYNPRSKASPSSSSPSQSPPSGWRRNLVAAAAGGPTEQGGFNHYYGYKYAHLTFDKE